MIRDTELQALTAEEIDRVAGGQADTPANLKLLSEILSNISKTRAEISMTFARNSRA